MGRMMEIRCIHDMDRLVAQLKRYNVKSGVQRNKCIQDCGMGFRKELKKQCLPRKVTGHLDHSIVCKPRKGGSEWRVFANSYINKLNRGTPPSVRFGEGFGGVHKGGAGILRKKLQPYASFYNKSPKWLADVLMKGGTKPHYVIDKAKAKLPQIMYEALEEFKTQNGVALKKEFRKKGGK